MSGAMPKPDKRAKQIVHPKRWAQVLVVDGVMGMIYHAFNSDDDRYQIRCTIKAQGTEITISVERRRPFTQPEFDAAGEDMVRLAISQAGDIGLKADMVEEESTGPTLQ